jgi:hypothetical protein
MDVVAPGDSRLSPLKRTLQPSILAVLDQCLFSGTNFLTAVQIGRVVVDAKLGTCAHFACQSICDVCDHRVCLLDRRKRSFAVNHQDAAIRSRGIVTNEGVVR